MKHAADVTTTWPEIPDLPSGQRPRGWLRLVAGVIIVAWIGGAATWVVARRAETLTLGYELAQASADRRRLLDELRSLELEVASLRSPARVGVAAAERMGLRPPGPREIRPIGGGGS